MPAGIGCHSACSNTSWIDKSLSLCAAIGHKHILQGMPLRPSLSNFVTVRPEGQRQKKNKTVEERIQKLWRSDKRKFRLMTVFEKRIFKPFAVHFTKIHFKTLLNTDKNFFEKNVFL